LGIPKKFSDEISSKNRWKVYQQKQNFKHQHRLAYKKSNTSKTNTHSNYRIKSSAVQQSLTTFNHKFVIGKDGGAERCVKLNTVLNAVATVSCMMKHAEKPYAELAD
jgi:hypothetical protein